MANQPKGGAGGGDANLGQYKYAAMSNLVLQADRRFVSRRGDETTGDPESLAGRINLGEMGSRTARETAPARPVQEQARKRKRTEPVQSSRAAGVLSQADLNIEGLRYRPRTSATTDVYNLISTQVARKMGGDYGLAITASATDSILEYLKDDNMKDFDKKKEIDDILGVSLTSQEMNQLVNLGKKITDYDAQDEDEVMEEEAGEGADIDERQGVAVDFGSEDEEDEGKGQTYEVRDEDDESEDEIQVGDQEDLPDADAPPPPVAENEDDEDDGMVIENRNQRNRTQQDPDIISAHEIDAYWLQRQVGLLYEDAHTQTEKTREAEEMMSAIDETGESKTLREVENDLMELFDYEHPELVGKL
ncbi:Pre-mRNA-splicing helicase BRR2, partial [Oleoguttula sp. CCFEE 5521]